MTTDHPRPSGAARPRSPAWWRDVAGLLTWGSMLVVVALWVSAGGVQDLTAGAGAGLTSAGRIAGLVAADLLLVQVALMARVPFVERSYGQDELARRHRLVGFTSFWLMGVHIVLAVLGYAAAATAGAWATAWDMVLTYPGMLLAAAGTALLTLVVVTSIRAARRRTRYETWHLIHLYGYLGAGLAVPHMLWTGTSFAASALARASWWSAWALVMAAVLVFRVGLPIRRSLRHRLEVAAVVPEGPGVVSVHLRGRELLRMPVEAGQYFVFRFAGPGRTRGHPVSLSAAPTDDRLRISVKVAGDGTGRIARLTPGTRVAIEGPYGRLTPSAARGRGAVLMGSGIGITPMRALLAGLDGGPGEVTVIHRASTPADLVLREEVRELCARRGAAYVELPGHRLDGSWLPEDAARWSDEDALLDIVPDVARRDVYICGPDAWMDAARRAARRAGVPQQQIHLERFSL
ncbi:ferredoxin reductase family protein [Georgenia muralis]